MDSKRMDKVTRNKTRIILLGRIGDNTNIQLNLRAEDIRKLLEAIKHGGKIQRGVSITKDGDGRVFDFGYGDTDRLNKEEVERLIDLFSSFIDKWIDEPVTAIMTLRERKHVYTERLGR